MINLITDVLQSLALCIFVFLVARKFYRLEHQASLLSLRSAVYKEPEAEAVCGCTHHQCFHDDNGCSGHDVVDRWKYDCGCKRYTGPEPLPQVIP